MRGSDPCGPGGDAAGGENRKHRSACGQSEDRQYQQLREKILAKTAVDEDDVLERAGIDLVAEHVLGQEKEKIWEQEHESSERQRERIFCPEKTEEQAETGEKSRQGPGRGRFPAHDQEGRLAVISRRHRFNFSLRISMASAVLSRWTTRPPSMTTVNGSSFTLNFLKSSLPRSQTTGWKKACLARKGSSASRESALIPTKAIGIVFFSNHIPHLEELLPADRAIEQEENQDGRVMRRDRRFIERGGDSDFIRKRRLDNKDAEAESVSMA